jgi:hypothetical protein
MVTVTSRLSLALSVAHQHAASPAVPGPGGEPCRRPGRAAVLYAVNLFICGFRGPAGITLGFGAPQGTDVRPICRDDLARTGQPLALRLTS